MANDAIVTDEYDSQTHLLIEAEPEGNRHPGCQHLLRLEKIVSSAGVLGCSFVKECSCGRFVPTRFNPVTARIIVGSKRFRAFRSYLCRPALLGEPGGQPESTELFLYLIELHSRIAVLGIRDLCSDARKELLRLIPPVSVYLRRYLAINDDRGQGDEQDVTR